MSLTVIRETADYLTVVARHIEKCSELGARFWQNDPRTPAMERLKSFVGCVWQLYFMVDPIVKLPQELEEALARLAHMITVRDEKKVTMAAIWHDTNKAMTQILKALHNAKMLIRVSAITKE